MSVRLGSHDLMCGQGWWSLLFPRILCDLNELRSLSVPLFSHLLNGLVNALQPQTIRNTLQLNRADWLAALRRLHSLRSRGVLQKQGVGAAEFELALVIWDRIQVWFGSGLDAVWKREELHYTLVIFNPHRWEERSRTRAAPGEEVLTLVSW